MRKTFKLDELDCANCGAKIEAGIKQIEGVNDAKVTFMTQKLMIDADDARFEQIVDEALKGSPQVRARLRHRSLGNGRTSSKRNHDHE